MRKFKPLRILSAHIIVTLVVAFGSLTVINTGTASAVSNMTLVTLTNNQRAAAGLAPLSWNGSLSQSAMLKTQDMCAKDYWAHDSPDGLTPWTFMDRAGYPYTIAGENLAKNFATDDGIMTGWMNSPGHRANILKTDFTDIGIATANCALQGVQTTLVVAHYGSTGRSTATQATPKTSPTKTPVTAPAQPKAVPTQPAVEPAAQPETKVLVSQKHVPSIGDILISLQKLVESSTLS
jgi:uncharacterized protein YkwD